MKQQNNNIDVFFKTEMQNAFLPFNKDKAWKKLEQKRTRKRTMKFSMVSAAILIIGLIVLFAYPKENTDSHITNEYQKRLKLKEYESKLSGTYKELLYCYGCEGEIIESQIKQVPEDQWILKVY